jgi:methyltransferase (TIGR00027 family)
LKIPQPRTVDQKMGTKLIIGRMSNQKEGNTMPDLDAVGTTSLMTAALRAIETRRPDRLMADPLAERLAGPFIESALKQLQESENDSSWPMLPAMCDNMAVRTRFFDEYLLSAVTERKISQIVIGAAGMDTRSYRISWPCQIRLYEIDRAAVLETKERELGDAVLPNTCERRTVAADLAYPDWIDKLGDAGFTSDQPTAWLFEGLFMYLSEQAVHHIFQRVRDTSAVGSLMAADVYSLSLMRMMRRRVAEADRVGGTWDFGVDDPNSLWRQYGFVAATTTVGSAAERYCKGSHRSIQLGTRNAGNYLVIGRLGDS